MLKSLKVIAKEYHRKDGGTFMKLSCKGEFLPLVTAEVDKYYTVKFAKGSLTGEPTKEGVYSIAFNEGELWVDNRIEMLDKNIVRVKVQRIRFEKPLTK